MKLTNRLKEALKPIDKAAKALNFKKGDSPKKGSKQPMAPAKSPKLDKKLDKLSKNFKGGEKNPFKRVWALKNTAPKVNADGSKEYVNKGTGRARAHIVIDDKKKLITIKSLGNVDDKMELMGIAKELGYKLKG